MFSGLYLLALLPLTPSLVGDHPCILELLKGSMTGMITMGAKARIGEASIVVAVLAAIPGLMMFDWLYWWAGRRWGKRAIDVFVGNHPKAVKRTAQLERLTRALRLARDRDRLLPAGPERARLRRRRLDADALRTFLLLDLIGSCCGSRSASASATRSASAPSTSPRRSPATRCTSRSR